MRSAPEHGGGIERGESLLVLVAPHAVDVIAVGGKGEACVTGGQRGNDLGVAGGDDVAQPKRLQAILIADVKKVLAVGREDGQGDVAVVGEVLNGNVLEGAGVGAQAERIYAERRSEKNDEGDGQRDSDPQFVFLRGGDQRGTGGRLGSGGGGPRVRSRRNMPCRRRRRGEAVRVEFALQPFQVSAQFRSDLIANIAVFF